MVHGKKGTGKMGTGKMGTGKKGTRKMSTKMVLYNCLFQTRGPYKNKHRMLSRIR